MPAPYQQSTRPPRDKPRPFRPRAWPSLADLYPDDMTPPPLRKVADRLYVPAEWPLDGWGGLPAAALVRALRPEALEDGSFARYVARARRKEKARERRAA